MPVTNPTKKIKMKEGIKCDVGGGRGREGVGIIHFF